jgi:hypothetical protein
MQSRRTSLAESITNVVVGFAVAVAVQMIVFPLFGVETSIAQSLGIGIAFTGRVAGTELHAAALLRWGFPGEGRGTILGPMASRRPLIDPVPDLLAEALHEGAVPRAVPPTPATVLPVDLPAALTRLPESDLKRLEAALALELRRRNLVTAPAARSAPEPGTPTSKRKVIEPIGGYESDGPALPSGKVNAIRAAAKAGVKPMTIAKQFGVSLSAIKTALEDKR